MAEMPIPLLTQMTWDKLLEQLCSVTALLRGALPLETPLRQPLHPLLPDLRSLSPPSEEVHLTLLNAQSSFQLSSTGFLEEKGRSGDLRQAWYLSALLEVNTKAASRAPTKLQQPLLRVHGQSSSRKRFSSPLFTCRSIYPSSVLESLEYLTLLLGMPAVRLVRDGIITGKPAHQLEPAKQRPAK